MKLNEILGSKGYTKYGPGDPETWPKEEKEKSSDDKSPDHNSPIVKAELQKKAKKWAENKKAEMAKQKSK